MDPMKLVFQSGNKKKRLKLDLDLETETCNPIIL